MQRRLRFLSIALAAGVAAVIAAAVPLLVQSAPPQQIQYVKTTSVSMPGMGFINMFTHGALKPTSETHTVGPMRERIDTGDTSEITQCDLKRIIRLDNKNKTYYAMTFAEIQAAMQQAMANAPKVKGMTPEPVVSQAPIQGSGQISLSVNTQEDPQPQTILGMSARHVVTTVTGKMTGSGQCPNGSMTFKTDEWYIPNEIHFSCPLPQAPFLKGNAPMPGPGGQVMQNPCMSAFRTQASGKAHTEDRFALKEDSTIDFGAFKTTTHEEVTKYEHQPYDPSFFDVPAGYTQVQPPSATTGH